MTGAPPLLAVAALLLDFTTGPRFQREERFAPPIVALNRSQSSNWAGYNQGLLEKNVLFTSVSGDWVVPTATLHSGAPAGDQYSATWLGIGGGCVDADCLVTDSTLVQAGTSQDVSESGRAEYSAWWEIIPGPSIDANLTVRAGDLIHGEVTEVVPGTWKLSLANRTTGQSFSITVPYSSTHATVEWIEETPIVVSSNGGVQIGPMPDLTTVGFSSLRVNGQPAGIVDAEAIELVDTDGSPIATPSAPLSGGTAFHVCTYRSSCS
jgi:hypothetical protein